MASSDYPPLKRAQLSLMALPEELLVYVLMFVADTDLQSLSKISPTLRRLCADTLLWRHLHLVRAPAQISSLLFRKTRPDRPSLLERNIIRGVQQQQLSDGSYIYGDSQRRFFDTQEKMRRSITQQTIRKRLCHRPDVAALQERGLLPETAGHATGSISPTLLPRLVHLKKALSQAHLNRQLQRRKTLSDIQSAGVIKVTTCAPALVAAQMELAKHFTEAKLDQKLSVRPSPLDVERAKILDVRAVAVIVCPSIRQKLQRFEAMLQEMLLALQVTHVPRKPSQ